MSLIERSRASSIRIGALLFAASLCACGGAETKGPAPVKTGGPGATVKATPPTLRLPRTVLPTRYTARLSLDPAAPDFTGHIEIEAKVSEPTRVVWLNAEHLSIDKATIAIAGADPVELEVIPVEHDFVGFRAPREIPPGAVTLAVDYAGKVDPTDTMGIFHQKDRGDWYLFTQFEALAARRAFPCFDEPDNKVTWQLSLEVPEKMTALTNTPKVSSAPTGGEKKLVEFARSKPMPSYLVAFAVGPFELVDAGRTKGGVKLRIVTPKGRAEEAKFAAEATLPILQLLEDYTGIPYPYAKLDSLAIPATVGFGAMEHAGLVTYSARILLSKPEELTLEHQFLYADVAAHELAHQWFGNLVTTAWWDDIWLNEAFATWMEAPILAGYRPKWHALIGRVTDKREAMEADRLATARKIHEPIESKDDVENAFDGITYAKGAAVLRMFEDWAGPKKWQGAMHAYLESHAWKSSTAEGFVGSIKSALGEKVGAAFSTFIEQVGAPVVSFELRCPDKKAPVISLSQRRYLPIGSEASADVTWKIPVCVEYPAGGKKGTARACTLLDGAQGELELSGAGSCPSWFLPSGARLGYYRMELPAPITGALLGAEPKTKLDLAARLGLTGNVAAMVAAGKAKPEAALALAKKLAGDSNRYAVETAIDVVEGLREDVPESARPAYARFVRRVFGRRARKLGWKARKGDSIDDRMIRPDLVLLAGVDGEDPRLIAQAKKQVRAWLGDREAVAPEMVDPALEIAARHGDEALFSALYEAARKEEVMSDRRRMLETLGLFSDPALARRALDLILGDEFHIRESSEILYKLLENRKSRRLAYDFVVEHFDALIKKLPEQAGAELADVAGAQCEQGRAEAIEKTFRPKIEPLPGGPRRLAQALEKRRLCVAAKRALAKPLAAFLSRVP